MISLDINAEEYMRMMGFEDIYIEVTEYTT